MNPRGREQGPQDIRRLEVKVARERKRTRLMKKSLRADRAALRAKKRELSVLKTAKDRLPRLLETGEILAAIFNHLEADGEMNLDDQNAMKQAIEAWLNNFRV